ncbi:hypothetical protein BGZ83_011371 [Gryganskiella cystojenkinii]|nr:hypothetical protein BGZ83_011371 [Gryganskiella cystojenkinii]
MTSHSQAETYGQKPRVLIAGAGIGGLFLAILLEKAGIPYNVYERNSKVKAVGSVMSLNASILPVLEQLGLYQKFQSISFPNLSTEILYENMQKIATVDTEEASKAVGYETFMVSRGRLRELFYSHLPKSKVHFNKKVVATEQTLGKVTIECEDGSTYDGDILVGADGSFSAVRKSMHNNLRFDDLLNKEDFKETDKGLVCLVGITNPLDPKENPIIKEDHAEYNQIIGYGTPYSLSLVNLPGNRVSYVMAQQVNGDAQCEDERFNGIHWEYERAIEMIKKVKDFNIPFGGTLEDLLDKTPTEEISRLYMEDRLYETWTDGRTVLIGNAAHKLISTAGEGSVAAMLDAVILTNSLYDLASLKPEAIETAFKDFKQERYSQVKYQLNTSSNVSAILYHGQALWERCVRYFILGWMPERLKNWAIVHDVSSRPQLSFLPQAPRRGTGPVLAQKSSKRYEAEQKYKKTTTHAL